MAWYDCVKNLCPPPIREVLSENGVGSFSRYTCFIVVIAATVWVSYLVGKNKALPDLSGLSLYVTGIIATLYGLNQAKGVASAIKGTGNNGTSNVTSTGVTVVNNPPAPNGGTNVTGS